MTFRHLRNHRGFFSDYYLGSAFGAARGKGRAGRDTEVAYSRFRRIRVRAEGHASDPASFRERFARPLLRDVLGCHLGSGDGRLHALFPDAEAEAAGRAPSLVAWFAGWDEDLDRAHGADQPMRRMGEELAHRRLRHGILLNGDRIRLVRVPGDGPRGAYLETDLSGLSEDEDPACFAAFLALFSFSAFIQDGSGGIPIEEIERESRLQAEKVSDDLKQAVFSAAESLAEGLIRDAAIRVPSTGDLGMFRDAALATLYRILFVLYAEARDPRLQAHRLYRESYSAQGLLDQILSDPMRSWPSNRCSFWERLRALFRIYDRGLPAVTPWENIPPRGGDFFSPLTPEGRIIDAARLPDDQVALLLTHLATTAPRRGIGRERVSFRELDIENLGAVYEGILEYEPRIAKETTLEIKVQGRTFALSPAEVIRICQLKDLSLRGDFSLVEGTEAEALHPEAPSLEDDEDADGEEDSEDEEGDEADVGVRKGASALLLRRLEPGTFHFVPGPGRKGSGSFYTPRPLARDLVRHALGPLVEGKNAAEIQNLRVLDPACGSAHFLVEAMRFLGQALHRALSEERDGNPPEGFRGTMGHEWDDNWKASDEEARATNSESRAWCKRRVAERCLFGVDLNRTAVQLARVALWIESAAGDRPLTYFEHHVRCGNSLLGTWMDGLERAPVPSLDKAGITHPGLFQDLTRRDIREAASIRRTIDRAEGEVLAREGIEAESVRALEVKERLRRKAEETLASARMIFDLRAAAVFVPGIWPDWEALCSLVGSLEKLKSYAAARPWWDGFKAACARESFFHWELEFPEVFLDEDRPGFDAVLGNPPWDKVLPARNDFYARHDVMIRAFTGNELDRRIKELHEAQPGLEREFHEYQERTQATADFLRHGGDFPHSEARSGAAHEDVSKFFLDRAIRLTRQDGYIGMVIPSVVYNGDGCVGLRKYILHDAVIRRFYGFENRNKVFPIDSRYKFVTFVMAKSSTADTGFQATFMRHDLEELDETALWTETGKVERAAIYSPWIVCMDRSEIERLSPETYALLEYRDSMDQRIIRTMYQGRETLGSQADAAWGAKLFADRAHIQIYNLTRDIDLWTDERSGRLYSPKWVLPRMGDDTVETIEKMREKGFWPVYEGKHVEQFVAGLQPFRWWLSVEKTEQKYGKPPRSEPTLVFRNIASNTKERTCIAVVMPGWSVAGNTFTGVLVESINEGTAASVFNSLVFDWSLRLRTAGTHVSYTYIQPMPVPSPAALRNLPTISTRLAWRSGIKHITEDRDTWPDLWKMNRAVAEAYGLGPVEFSHVLESFPGMARKRKEFHAYLLARIGEWRAETG